MCHLELFFIKLYFQSFMALMNSMYQEQFFPSLNFSAYHTFPSLFLHYTEKGNRNQANKISISPHKDRIKEENVKIHWNMKGIRSFAFQNMLIKGLPNKK